MSRIAPRPLPELRASPRVQDVGYTTRQDDASWSTRTSTESRREARIEAGVLFSPMARCDRARQSQPSWREATDFSEPSSECAWDRPTFQTGRQELRPRVLRRGRFGRRRERSLPGRGERKSSGWAGTVTSENGGTARSVRSPEEHAKRPPGGGRFIARGGGMVCGMVLVWFGAGSTDILVGGIPAKSL